MASIVHLSKADASQKTLAVDGFAFAVCPLPAVAGLKRAVEETIDGSARIKAGRLEGVDVAEEPALAKLLVGNYLFDLIRAMGLPEQIFGWCEAFCPTGNIECPQGHELVHVIWSTQLRSVPADLIHRAKPNPWTDGAAAQAHVDAHEDRVLTEYVVDAARLEDCWNHSKGFRDLVSRWMRHACPHESADKETDLRYLTTDMRRFRYARGNVQQDAQFPAIPQGEVEAGDQLPSTFWAKFLPVPVDALSFWCNLTPNEGAIAKPLAFGKPGAVELVADRSQGKRPMPPRAGAGDIKWATQTLAGPEYKPQEQTYAALFEQSYGTVAVFDTRFLPHVAAHEEGGATRVSLEGRRLTFAIDASDW